MYNSHCTWYNPVEALPEYFIFSDQIFAGKTPKSCIGHNFLIRTPNCMKFAPKRPYWSPLSTLSRPCFESKLKGSKWRIYSHGFQTKNPKIDVLYYFYWKTIQMGACGVQWDHLVLVWGCLVKVGFWSSTWAALMAECVRDYNGGSCKHKNDSK